MIKMCVFGISGTCCVFSHCLIQQFRDRKIDWDTFCMMKSLNQLLTLQENLMSGL